MFKTDNERDKKAFDIANWLSTHNNFKSHGRHLPRTELEKKGLAIDYLEQDQTLQELVLSVFHATNHTFAGSSVKIIENHLGHAFIKHVAPQFQMPIRPLQIQQPPPQRVPPTAP
jgi:hypothetical protein